MMNETHGENSLQSGSSQPGFDINCDLGEGMGNDEAILPFITSANIACGAHAGDEETMRKTMKLAMQHGVKIGAHPSFPDRDHFGRTEMKTTPEEVYQLVSGQLLLFKRIADPVGARVRHVKPHGALYNMAARQSALAKAIAKAVKDFDASLVVFGLSGSASVSEARALGLQAWSEVFADRTYQDNGALTPRSQANALIEEEAQSIQQVLQMVKEKTVRTVSGKTIPLAADTICLHGDGRNAVAFAKKIMRTLQQQNLVFKAL